MEDNMFYAKIVLHAWQTCKKSSQEKERRECWAVLSGNVTKLAQQTELQLAVILALHEHENTKVVFSLYNAIDQWMRDFCWSFWLKDHIVKICYSRIRVPVAKFLTQDIRFIITPPTMNRGAEYCDNRVCLCVYLSASISLKIHVRSLPTNFCACYLW